MTSTKTGGSNFNAIGDGANFTGTLTNTSSQAVDSHERGAAHGAPAVRTGGVEPPVLDRGEALRPALTAARHGGSPPWADS